MDWRKVDTRWIRQRDPENKSEWYFADQADLLVWRRKDSGLIVRFEMTWERAGDADRYFLRWENGWICGTVDMGDNPGGHKMAPTVNEEPTRLLVIRLLAEEYLMMRGLELRSDVRAFVLERLREP